MTEFLTSDELRDLTQRARREAQAAELEAMGIPYRQQRQRLLVSRQHARDWLAGIPLAASRQPNMGAIR